MLSNTYDEVACDDLQDLRAQARTPGEDFLKEIDQEVAHWRTDESTVCSHLRHSRAKVVALLAAIVREPRREDF